jgi:hypothetical protein
LDTELKPMSAHYTGPCNMATRINGIPLGVEITGIGEITVEAEGQTFAEFATMAYEKLKKVSLQPNLFKLVNFDAYKNRLHVECTAPSGC